MQSIIMSAQMLLRRNENMKDIAILQLYSGMLSPTKKQCLGDGPEHDFHAGLAETSCMMYWRPDLVRMDRLKMDEEYVSRMMRTDQDWYEHKEKSFDHPAVIERVTQREEIKVGVMGFPEKASREIGEKICNEIIENLAKIVDDLNARVK